MRRRSPAIALFAAVMLAGCTGPGPDARRSPAPPATEVSWTRLAPVPTPRTEVAAAVADGRIHVVGGFAEEGTTVPTVEVYDVSADAWTPGPDLPVAVNHAMAVAADGTVLVVGGYLQGGEPSDRAFALARGGWEELPRMPEPRAAGGAAMAGGRVYVVGGVGPGGLAERTLVYDPAVRRWSTASGLRTPREHLGVAAAGDLVYALAGRVGGLEGNIAAAEAYDPSTDRWAPLPRVPTPRGGTAAAAANGFVVLAGGEQPGGTFDEAEAFDIARGAWISLPPMPTGRHGLALAAVGTVVYALAGGIEPGLTFSDAAEAVDLAALG